MSRIKLQLCFTLTIALLGSISCMQAEKISLDTSGAEGALIGLVAGDLNLLGGGEADNYTGFRFVAAGNGAFWHSEDGKIWEPAYTDESGNVKAIAFGNGIWVAVGADSAGSCKIWTSSTGKGWNSMDCPSGGNNEPRTGVAYGNGMFIVTGGKEGTSPNVQAVILRSYDGQSWTRYYTPPSSDQEMASVAYIVSTKHFVVAGLTNSGGFAGSGSDAFLSSDGSNWTPIDLPSSADDIRIQAGPGSTLFVYGKYHDSGVINQRFETTTVSGNSISDWSPSGNLPNPNDYIYSFAYGKGTHVAVGNGYSDCKIYYSQSGVAWAPATAPFGCASGGGHTWSSVVYSPASSLFVAGGISYDTGITFAWSDNGINWNISSAPGASSQIPTVIAVAK